MPKKPTIAWMSEPDEHNFEAAGSYLGLLYDDATVKARVAQLRRAPAAAFKAKDMFRASGLPLLGLSNVHLERDREKIKAGEALAPLLLVRDSGNGRVIIADGYHRMCAIYSYNEDAVIPCRIV